MTTTPRTPPVVYLGPSAPEADIRVHLPDAVIRPPVRRGDLYRDRLLRYSVFVVLDGVFAQEDAISPREVVDVLRDGAAVVGAASMGALRAVDCAPAGAEGVGLVHRLFAANVLNSEDEVAVLFNPEKPFPALSDSLVSMRVALRRAVRSGRIAAETAERLAERAASMHFSDRSWRNAVRAAGFEAQWERVGPFLAGQDIKRADAVAAAAVVARRIARNPAWGHRPRRGNGTFGLLRDGRERAFDVWRGLSKTDEIAGFSDWMFGSGRASSLPGFDLTLDQNSGTCRVDRSDLNRRLFDDDNGPAARPDFATSSQDVQTVLRVLTETGQFEVEWLRYAAVQASGACDATRADLCRAEREIVRAFGASDWSALSNDPRVLRAKAQLGRAFAWRRKQFVKT